MGRTKSGKVRSIPLSGLAAEWLGSLIRFVGEPQVIDDPGRREPYRCPRPPFEEGRSRAGLEWATLHSLRHFRATQWLSHGVSVRTVQQLLGHASIQTTMRYLHYVDDQAAPTVLAAQEREREQWERIGSGAELEPEAERR